MAAASSEGIGEAYKQEFMNIKSRVIYDKWWERYMSYCTAREINIPEITSYMNWLCSMKQENEYAPTTIITAASCVNSRLKINHDKNFMDHILVKDLIRKLHKNSAPKQAAVFSYDQIENFVLNAPESLGYKVKLGEYTFSILQYLYSK